MAWPSSLYHVCDRVSAASILSVGHLYCRARCIELGILKHDSASPGIIQQSPHAHTFARLYFRPCTPTQSNMEGIRPRDRRIRGAHLPVPFMLVFDAVSVLTRSDTCFTDGNFGTAAQRLTWDSAEALNALPWEQIYHDEPLPRGVDARQQIIDRRNAEVLVPTELPLDGLREVVCRSGPERDTLLHALAEHRARWQDRIRLVRQGERMFFGSWAYVTDVSLLTDVLVVTFNTVTQGPFSLEAKVWYPGDSAPRAVHTETRTRLSAPLLVQLDSPPERVGVSVRVEGCTAYHAFVSRRSLF